MGIQTEGNQRQITIRLGEAVAVEGIAAIKLVRIDGGQCRLGILADESVNVRRGELSPLAADEGEGPEPPRAA